MWGSAGWTLIQVLSLFLILASVPARLEAQANDEINKSRDRQASLGEDLDLTTSEFNQEFRIGMTQASGNTESLVLTGSNRTRYRLRRVENTVRAGGHYNRISRATGTTTTGTVAQYLYGTYRLDYYFLPRLTTYLGGGGYTDEIKGIEVAGQGFTGVTYYFWRRERLTLGGSVGYDFTYEDRVGTAGNQEIHSATVGVNYWQKLNSIVSLSETLEAQQDVTAASDFRLQSQTDLKVSLTTHLAIVLGFGLRFDNQPVSGFRKWDTLTDVSIALLF